MFKLWVKILVSGKIREDRVISCDDESLNRTKKIFQSLEKACHEFDLGKPIWFESNIQEFKKLSKTRFSADHFIEEIDFDFMEMEVIEEDLMGKF